MSFILLDEKPVVASLVWLFLIPSLGHLLRVTCSVPGCVYGFFDLFSCCPWDLPDPTSILAPFVPALSLLLSVPGYKFSSGGFRVFLLRSLFLLDSCVTCTLVSFHWYVI